MSYIFTDYNRMVGKRPRQIYWKELQDAVNELNKKFAEELTSSRVNAIGYKPATEPIYSYPVGITTFQVTEDVSTGYPALDGVVETVYINEFRNIQHFFEYVAGEQPGPIYYRQWKEEFGDWSPWLRLITDEEMNAHVQEFQQHVQEFEEHRDDTNIHLTPLDRQRMQGYTHYQVSPSTTWTITHNLEKRPSVTVVDSGGNVLIGDVQYLSDNQIKITFTTALSGTAYLN